MSYPLLLILNNVPQPRTCFSIFASLRHPTARQPRERPPRASPTGPKLSSETVVCDVCDVCDVCVCELLRQLHRRGPVLLQRRPKGPQAVQLRQPHLQTSSLSSGRKRGPLPTLRKKSALAFCSSPTGQTTGTLTST
jgi:hypothetical protein